MNDELIRIGLEMFNVVEVESVFDEPPVSSPLMFDPSAQLAIKNNIGNKFKNKHLLSFLFFIN